VKADNSTAYDQQTNCESSETNANNNCSCNTNTVTYAMQ